MACFPAPPRMHASATHGVVFFDTVMHVLYRISLAMARKSAVVQ